jgi:signal transduction histidine kinase
VVKARKRDDKGLQKELHRAEHRIERLRVGERKRKGAQHTLEHLTFALKERVKELNCLYKISRIVEKKNLSLAEILQATVDTIPDAWQYPEITCSRIVLESLVFQTHNFKETPWKQSQNIPVQGVKSGSVEVFYLEDKPDRDEGPFLREERSLIDVIAERVGKIVERQKAEEALRMSEAKNRALLNAIPDLMFQIDSEGTLLGFHEGKYTFLSGLLKDLLGTKIYRLSDEMNYLPRRVLDQSLRYGRRALGTRKPQVFEQHLIFGEGEQDFEVRMVVCGEGEILGIVRDVTSRRRLEREILEISGREQRRIGQDLHDGLCQHLAGVGFLGKVLEKKLRAGVLPSVLEAGEIVELLDQAVTLTRGFARGLNPVSLEAEGLMHALRELALSTQKLYGISCRFECSEPVFIHDNAVATHLYRIVQEALGNSIKHGKARSVVINLLKDGAMNVLTVKDDGIGIGNAKQKGKGMGLSIMSYRASVIGGLLDIRDDEMGGTILVCSFEGEGGN